mgnify:CR=1 FL=1
MQIIAEIGTSHGGSIKKAKELIDVAANAGADIVKFQWVYADEILHPETGFVKLPTGNIRLYDRFKSLEVSQDFFAECLSYSHQKGLLFACSPFGLKSLEKLVSLNPDAIKIASPEVNHKPLLEKTAEFYGKIPIILSGGVSKLCDLEKALETLRAKRDASANKHLFARLPDITLLHCLTFYPAPEAEYNVRLVKTLHSIFGVPCGISDHSLDPILVPVLACAMGGTLIEKHITISRKTDGLDDPVALEGEQFAQMVMAIRQTEALISHYKKSLPPKGAFCDEIPPEALGDIFSQLEAQFSKERVFSALGDGVKRLAQIEEQNYGRTNRSLHYTRALQKGEVVQANDVAVLRTEKILTPGISPDFLSLIQGKVLQKSVENGSGVQLDDFFVKG